MRFYIETLGCPKNRVDSEMMTALLEKAGHAPVTAARRAQVILVNTCGFIDAARAETLQSLRELASHKRVGQWLVAAGCLAQRAGLALFAQVPEIDALLGTRNWADIAGLFDAIARGAQRPLLWVRAEGNLVTAAPREGSLGASAYIKIADGCDAACAFCAIPQIKGPQRSKPPQEVVAEAAQLAAQGVREAVLIAQDTTAYGRDLGLQEGLAELLSTIAAAAPALRWLRVLYAYPQHVTPHLIGTLASLPAICHYLDVPLQHAHPDTLRRMRRPHDVDQALRLVADLRSAMPDVALRSTFIVGFPGESEAEFQGLLAFLEEVRFDKVGVFGYSLEEGTPAAELPGRVPDEVIDERRQRAMETQQRISLARNQEQVGRELDILVEGVGEGLTVGRSYRDAPEIDGMVLMAGEEPVGEFVRGRIVGAQEYDLIAEVIRP